MKYNFLFKIGFDNWGKALDSSRSSLLKHNESIKHKFSMAKWESFQSTQQSDCTVIDLINPRRKKLLNENKLYIQSIFEYVKYFAIQEIPFRGHDESIESPNRGNFTKFIQLMLRTNSEFYRLHEQCIKQFSSSIDYTSKTIYEEMIQTIASSIRNEIKKEVNNAHAYSLLLDESKDNSNHELLSGCVRYFYENGPVERFCEFIELHDLTSDGILNAIDHIISSFSLCGNRWCQCDDRR